MSYMPFPVRDNDVPGWTRPDSLLGDMGWTAGQGAKENDALSR